MSLQSRLSALISEIGLDIKTLQTGLVSVSDRPRIAAWGRCTGAGVKTVGTGFTVAKVSTGLYTITLTTSIASAAYAITIIPEYQGGSSQVVPNQTSVAAGSFQVRQVVLPANTVIDAGFSFTVTTS